MRWYWPPLQNERTQINCHIKKQESKPIQTIKAQLELILLQHLWGFWNSKRAQFPLHLTTVTFVLSLAFGFSFLCEVWHLFRIQSFWTCSWKLWFMMKWPKIVFTYCLNWTKIPYKCLNRTTKTKKSGYCRNNNWNNWQFCRCLHEKCFLIMLMFFLKCIYFCKLVIYKLHFWEKGLNSTVLKDQGEWLQ